MKDYQKKTDTEKTKSMAYACKVDCQYPTGDTPSAKVPVSSQKTNPARRNRSY